MMRRSVVFPQPDGPRSATNSPSATVSETSLSARWAPKSLLIRSMTISAIGRSRYFDPMPHAANRYFRTARMKRTDGTMSRNPPAKR